ncbi:MAG: 2-amino-4-hydroxy-6-hydroxymethyldihydropteridine diphosphokinase [Prevotella pectinovora]|jgi:2-amino-4-hydroxy-6-hydroxymethyldihydropteridine diphosphokinase|uniref:2-amino-4-hydroxy-6-hydroxymethyldihydropteridine pyrophosphokinase n=2 Tax=Prevotella pectinovora TaxID=1602169 RepID=A0A0D0I335_9BACT|nr:MULTISPECIES: 2-amino-4-hydroxy-6-hydroxymethyldihydropteridine diphosphokinase [Prevotella]KIP54198.1 2-amino-4-hydroxy-6-hydroxymethyldihydropteridine pyrophosphokinase [Prevotella pectinovora]KIP54350.1 2-amino-4-hydroxy-6-hydroxymethyldihydropteridine pyrophosphokinase [Prevotella pectinovora]KIP57156.1 2-amino-4-hydroxy-6-hydroxymethyldihydropteridine pyrophosphokinase [Prevotella pectinovora]KIP60213.1 2-amino-4-hydroxy-6-hydroxymethyldihydropteridine pyrophosphokinase [Prevotella pect
MIAYLSLGTNLGDKRKNIAEAIKNIGELVGDVVRQSALYETEPWGFRSDNRFVNAAVCVDTQLSPRRLLEVTQRIEREMGRTLKSDGGEYHDRIIDIDILLYGDLHIDEPDLKIPHPLMHERDFVMTPLNEIMEE